MADNVPLPAAAGNAAADEATYSGDTAKVQLVKLAWVTGAEGAKTIAPLAGDETDGLLVNMGANNDVTVTGSVTANLAAGTNNIGDVDVLSLPAIPAGTNNIGDVDVLTVPAPLSTTGGGTEATALRVTLASDSTGVVSVDDNGASLTIDAPVGTPAFVRLSDGAAAITTLPVSLATLPALVAGTANIGDVDVLTIAAGDNNIGNVDIVTMPNVTLAAGTNTNEVVGDVAHSVAAAGNPVLIAGVAQAHDDTAPPNRVDAESDATRLATDFDGSVFVRPHGPQVWCYHVNGSSALTDTSVHAAPGAGLSLYVGTIVFSSGAATAINMFLEEGASTVMGPYYLEATAGRGLCIQFNPPRKITANTALTITTSAAIAHSVDICGFTAQG